MPYVELAERLAQDTLSRAAFVPSGQSYILTRNIPAIQILPGAVGRESKLGPLTQLPQSAELETCGYGFDSQTLAVRCNGSFYYVFLDDLEPVRKPAASAASAGKNPALS